MKKSVHAFCAQIYAVYLDLFFPKYSFNFKNLQEISSPNSTALRCLFTREAGLRPANFSKGRPAFFLICKGPTNLGRFFSIWSYKKNLYKSEILLSLLSLRMDVDVDEEHPHCQWLGNVISRGRMGWRPSQPPSQKRHP